MNPEAPLISTKDLQTATDYINDIVATVREAHSDGVELDVERLTKMMVYAILCTGTPPESVMVQQSLMLAIAIQKLAL